MQLSMHAMHAQASLCGAGFQIDLNHTTTARRIQARGLRATDVQGRTMGDVVWMSDVTEGVAA